MKNLKLHKSLAKNVYNLMQLIKFSLIYMLCQSQRRLKSSRPHAIYFLAYDYYY